MGLQHDIATSIEVHSPEGIRACFEHGLDPNVTFEGSPLIEFLTSIYTRSSRFGACVQVFVDYGLRFEDDALLAVLLDDPKHLSRVIKNHSPILDRRITMTCAYTPLYNANLLHVCAEFNRIRCAELLLDLGVDVNVHAGTDDDGFGGQTPIFHTVNQNGHQSKEVMDLLLRKGADLHHTVMGLRWGKDMPWETFIPAVNPISYAMFGCLPQMHRSEKIISEVVAGLMKHAYGIDFSLPNVPNKYLATS